MESTTSEKQENPTANTSTGEQSTEQKEKQIALKLWDLKSYLLNEGGPTAREASDEEFLLFASSVVGLGREWSVEERRDFLNWALLNGLVEVERPEGKPNFFLIKNSGKQREDSSST